MNISKFKIVWSFLFGGGVSGVADYLLGVLKNVLNGLNEASKEKLQYAFNVTKKILEILKVIAFLVPTKWQAAYALTLAALCNFIERIEDLDVTTEELMLMVSDVNDAIEKWQSPDDETCVDCIAC